VAEAAGLQDAPLAGAVGAVCSGSVTFDQLRSIARGIKDLPPEPATRAADLLVGLCPQVDAARVRYAARYLAHVVDPEGAARSFEAQFQARRASFAPMLDGMWRLEAFADPEGSATLQAALDAAMAPSSADDTRSTTQRRYDALIELARFSLEHGGVPSVGGVRPQILVTCSPESLSGTPGAAPAVLPDATPLPAGTLARIACDAAINRVVFGPSGAVLDLGRTRRFFTPAQRLALWARDRGCRFPGCGAPWTHAHHVIPWQHGGATDLDTGVLLCPTHHRHVHEGGWAITVTDATLGTHGPLSFSGPTGQRFVSDPPGPHWPLAPPDPDVSRPGRSAGVPVARNADHDVGLAHPRAP
jgi:hypothetical protein